MHSNYTLLMSLVLDQEAGPAEEAELRAHLRECNTCAATWQHWQEIDRRFAAAPAMSAPEGITEAIFARVDQVALVQARRKHFAIWFGLAGAAALILTSMMTLAALNWPTVSPALSAALSGLSDMGGWLLWAALRLVASAGAPAVAAAGGALLSLTCGLAVAWLWIVNHGVTQARAPHVA